MTAETVKLKGATAKHKTARIQAVTGPGVIVRDQMPPMDTHHTRIHEVIPDFQVVVYGSPAPKGSMTYKGHQGGRPVLGSASEGAKPWEEAVRKMVRLWVAKTPGWECINEAVFVAVSFTMPLTAAAEARGDTEHLGVPDEDKLLRNTIDGLCITPIPAGEPKHLPEPAKSRVRDQMRAEARRKAILHDDSLVNGHLVTGKYYAGTSPTALRHPGAVIQVWRKSRLAPAA